MDWSEELTQTHCYKVPVWPRLQNLSEKRWLQRAEADVVYLLATFSLILIPCVADDCRVFPKVRKNQNYHFTSFCYTQDYITTTKESYQQLSCKVILTNIKLSWFLSQHIISKAISSSRRSQCSGEPKQGPCYQVAEVQEKTDCQIL